MKKQGFLQGSMILIASAAAVKVIGAIFRIPLANMLGGTGMGYFSSAYGIFMTVYAASATGLPLAAAKLTAEYSAAGKTSDLPRIRQASALLCTLTGLVFTVLMLALAVPFCMLTGSGAAAVPAVIVIAPSVLFSCASAAYRGYFEGRRNMYPTALSQVAEAVVKLVTGIFLCAAVIFTFRHSPEKITALTDKFSAIFPQLKGISAAEAVMPLAAAAAVAGVTLSTLAGLLFVMAMSLGGRKNDVIRKNGDLSFRCVSARLFAVIIPASAGALITNLTSLIDLTTIINSLSRAAAKAPEAFAKLTSAGIAVNELPNFIFGSFTGLAVTVFNLVPSFTNMFGKGAVPSIAEAYSSGNRKQLSQTTMNVIFTAAFVAVPAGIGISALSRQILELLFPSRGTETEICVLPLRILGLAVVFLSVSSVIFSSLQAAGRGDSPVKIMAAGVIVKLIGNIMLVGIPMLNVSGAAASTLLCYGLICALSFSAAEKYLAASARQIYAMLGKMCFCGILCGTGAVLAEKLLWKCFETRLVLLPAVLVGIAIYIISTYLVGILSKSTLKLLIC